VAPPGPGFITASSPAPDDCVSLAGKATCKLVPERNVVTREEPFQVHIELVSNPVPVRVIVAGEPSGIVSGAIEVTRGFWLVTSKGALGEVPPPGAGFATLS
jgi:hypothetical protein